MGACRAGVLRPRSKQTQAQEQARAQVQARAAGTACGANGAIMLDEGRAPRPLYLIVWQVALSAEHEGVGCHGGGLRGFAGGGRAEMARHACGPPTAEH
eukprot:scaffold45633_cov85-Phaeocystis_antarctica.AAC.1